MTRFFHALAGTAALLAAGQAFAAPASEPGGAGTLKVAGLQQSCFKVQGSAITEACGSVQVHWKLWTLMGEPVSDFALTWQLSDIRLKTQGGAQSGERFTLGSLPEPIAAAARKLELSLDGVAHLNVPGGIAYSSAALRFDTGASVRPGGSRSVSVPSGYDWNRFLFVAAPNDSACQTGQVRYLEAGAARQVMLAGVTTHDLTLCPGNTLDGSVVDTAVQTFCDTGKNAAGHRYCTREREKKPATDNGFDTDSVLDKSYEKTRRADRARAIEAECKELFAPIAQCLAQSDCGSVQGEQCKNVPPRPADEMSGRTTCDDKPRNDSTASSGRKEVHLLICAPIMIDKGGRDWDRKWGELARQCKTPGNNRSAADVAECKAQANARCNPHDFSVQQCLVLMDKRASGKVEEPRPAARSSFLD